MSADAVARPNHETVFATLHAELVDAGVEEDVIGPDALFDELDVSSLDVAQILAAIRTRFDVILQQSDIAGSTVGQVVQKVVASSPY